MANRLTEPGSELALAWCRESRWVCDNKGKRPAADKTTAQQVISDIDERFGIQEVTFRHWLIVAQEDRLSVARGELEGEDSGLISSRNLKPRC
jgi:hypothetical protein